MLHDAAGIRDGLMNNATSGCQFKPAVVQRAGAKHTSTANDPTSCVEHTSAVYPAVSQGQSACQRSAARAQGLGSRHKVQHTLSCAMPTQTTHAVCPSAQAQAAAGGRCHPCLARAGQVTALSDARGSCWDCILRCRKVRQQTETQAPCRAATSRC